jgi:acyl-CoA synthetase (AMP-forming)/AMP-acid ligase II
VELTGRHRTLRYITVSGGSLTVPELTALSTMVPGLDIFKTYGQTESFRSTMLLPGDFQRKIGSVGRPCPGARVRIVAEDGCLCPPGQTGEVVHSGIGVMAGYLDGSDRGVKRRENPFRDGEGDSAHAIWTGDLGYLDEDGFLFLKGRRDGMLKVSGNRFYPDEVASVAAHLDGVADVEVLGLDPDAVETRVALFVVAPAAQWSSQRMIDVLRQRLPSYMVPTLVRVLPAMPRLANGKTDRVRLRELVAGSPGAEE